MEGEGKSFMKVWTIALICLCYCYYVASRIPKGFFRLFSLLPVFFLFIILPLHLTSIHLGGCTAFFLTWLAIFKLLLFSFNLGPLSPLPPKLSQFIFLACLPIKPNQDPLKKNIHSKPSSILLPIKTLLLAITFQTYDYKQLMHPYAVLCLYCLHLYLELEIVLAISATPARALLGFELEPQFNEPYLTTSLQDFWGHRWNLTVTNILRPTVYFPVRNLCKRVVGPKWASPPAVFAVFAVSGLMHEVIYFYITRANPTWEVTGFFVLHGVCVAVEVAVKKVVRGRWTMHRAASGLLTISFVAVTAKWLFFPQIVRNGVDERIKSEYSYCGRILKQKINIILFDR